MAQGIEASVGTELRREVDSGLHGRRGGGGGAVKRSTDRPWCWSGAPPRRVAPGVVTVGRLEDPSRNLCRLAELGSVPTP